MSFGGSVADMLHKMKYNRSLRDSNRGNYDRYRDAVVTYKKSRLKLKNEDISKEQLEIIKQDVIREVKRRNQIAVLLTITLTLIVCILMIWVFRQIMNLTPDFLNESCFRVSSILLINIRCPTCRS